MDSWAANLHLDGSTLSVIVASGALCWLHKELSFPCELFPLTRRTRTHGKEHETVKEDRVEQELINMQVAAWKVISRILVHVQLPALLMSLVDFYFRLDVNSFVWAFFNSLAYLAYVLTIQGCLQITIMRVRCVCLTFHFGLLLFTVGSAWESPGDAMWRHALSVSGQIILALMFPTKEVVAAFAVTFYAAYMFAGVNVFGYEAVFQWSWMVEHMVLVMIVIGMPVITENLIRDRIAASFQSDDAHSLVLAFRRMLRGVCDGDVLLDSSYKICGNDSCLRRLLGCQESLIGQQLDQLLVQEKEVLDQLKKFLADSGTSDDEREGPPKCLRVPLQASGGLNVAVDVFHVALPGLYGTSDMHHLLAITEDAESRVQPEADQHAIPRSLLSARGVSAASGRSQSVGSSQTRAEVVEFYDELSEMTLLLNASTDSIDIEEATMHFARRSERGLGMPTLRKFIRPLDWHGVEAKLQHFAHELAQRRRTKPKNFPQLMLRLPGENKTYLRARSVSLESVYGGFLPEGEPTYLYLHLSKFNEGRRKRLSADRQRLEGVEEDVSHEL